MTGQMIDLRDGNSPTVYPENYSFYEIFNENAQATYCARKQKGIDTVEFKLVQLQLHKDNITGPFSSIRNKKNHLGLFLWLQCL